MVGFAVLLLGIGTASADFFSDRPDVPDFSETFLDTGHTSILYNANLMHVRAWHGPYVSFTFTFFRDSIRAYGVRNLVAGSSAAQVIYWIYEPDKVKRDSKQLQLKQKAYVSVGALLFTPTSGTVSHRRGACYTWGHDNQLKQ